MSEQRDHGGTSTFGEGTAWKWFLLSGLVWVVLIALSIGGELATPVPLALVAIALAAAGIVRLAMDWAVKNFSPRQD